MAESRLISGASNGRVTPLLASLANSATAEALDAVLELRGYVEALQAIQLPKGFGRD